MALFRLSFCWCIDTGFHSITFAGMHWFYWKFAEGYIIVKYRSSLVIIRKFLGKLWPFFDLVAFRDMSDYKDQCFFPYSYRMVGALSRCHIRYSEFYYNYLPLITEISYLCTVVTVMGKQCCSQAVLQSGSWGHSVLQTPALVNISLKLWSLNANIFAEKMWVAFAFAKIPVN